MIAAIGLGEILWALLVLYIIVSVLIGTVAAVLDVIRSDDVSGPMKGVWLVAFLLLPMVTVVVYLIARGDGMGERSLAREARPVAPPAGYSGSPASELRQAKELLDDGTLTAEQFEDLKRKILS